MNFELTGKLFVKYDTKTVSKNPEKPFNKREFVVETTETGQDGREFKETIPFQATGDRTNIVDAANVGDNVTVTFNIRGRGWQKDAATPMRYFGNLEAWKIEKVAQAAGGPPNLPDVDDMPF